MLEGRTCPVSLGCLLCACSCCCCCSFLGTWQRNPWVLLGFITREHRRCKAEPGSDAMNFPVRESYGSQGWAKFTVLNNSPLRIWIRKAHSYFLLLQTFFLNYQNHPSVASALKIKGEEPLVKQLRYFSLIYNFHFNIM